MPFLRPENIVYSKGCTSPTHDWWCHGTFPPIRATTVSRPTRWPSWKEKIKILTEPVSFLFLIPRLFLRYQTFSYRYRPLFWDQFLWLRYWNHKKERYSRPRRHTASHALQTRSWTPFPVGAQSFCHEHGGGGDGGLHSGPSGLLPLLPFLHQICQGEPGVFSQSSLGTVSRKMLLFFWILSKWGGGGPAQIFWHLVISEFLVKKRSRFPPKCQ